MPTKPEGLNKFSIHRCKIKSGDFLCRRNHHKVMLTVKGVQTWGNFMTTATSIYPRDPTGLTVKILFLSDSTTTIAKWVTIHVPEGKLDCLCAKARLFNNWAAMVSHCQYLPMHVGFIPGTLVPTSVYRT